MGVHDKTGPVLPRAIARLRQSLEEVLLSHAVGSHPAMMNDEPLRIDDEQILEEVRSTIAIIREAEALIGAIPSGPPWLERVISGKREVTAK